MGRKLPDPITRNPGETDEEFSKRRQLSKHRVQVFKRVYQNMDHWRALMEDHGMGPVITTPDGEDIYINDLMVGQDTLPLQQRRAFDKICRQGYTESAATAEILPNSKWSTPVQQYSDDGLKKMILAYDAKQAGTWDPKVAVVKKRRKKKDIEVTTAVEPALEVPEDAQDETAPKVRRVDHLNWTVCSEDNASLADYIKAQTGLEITGQMVKAVKFLHKPWYRSPEQVAHRAAVAEAKAQEQAKYAYETSDQREKRFEAARRLKAMQAAVDRAAQLQQEVRQLRIDAGLDPETGEPVAA
jgi:hypothetical protein